MNLHFRQTFLQGYRYLDRCGEFMVRAEKELDFIPSDARPIGAKLAIPEKAIELQVDTESLALVQSNPSLAEFGEFRELCINAGALAVECFDVPATDRLGFACISICTLGPNEAQRASQKVVETGDTVLGRNLDMISTQLELSERFTSGSRELMVKTTPIAYSHRPTTVEPVAFGVSNSRRKRAGRFEKAAARKSSLSSGHGLQLYVDLMEDQPADNQTGILFDDMVKYWQTLQSALTEIF